MISFDRYIKIVSGKGAGAVARTRDLILRILTTSKAVAPGVILETSSLPAIAALFGRDSEEYKRSERYFSFVSKGVTSPAKISFARFVTSATAPSISGDTAPKKHSDFLSVVGGVLGLTDGKTNTLEIANIDLSTTTNLTDVATKVQEAIRTVPGADPYFANCSVVFNTVTNQFILTAGTVGASPALVSKPLPGIDLGAMLGFQSANTVNSAGMAIEKPADAIARSAKSNSNFGTYLFAPRLSTDDFTDDEIVAVASWNHAQNNKFMYLQGVRAHEADTFSALFDGYSGCGLIQVPEAVFEDYVDQAPAEIIAAIDYDRVEANENFMYYQFPTRRATVEDDTRADELDVLRVNYIGATEKAGQTIEFFQRGTLCGGTEAATDMNVFANEMWLKDFIASEFMNLFLNLKNVTPDPKGRAALLSVLQTCVGKAKDNAVISIGKELSNTQKQYINQLTGNPMAWRRVQGEGAYFDVTFDTETDSSGRTEHVAKYMLVYGTGDSIRKVTGSNVMI